ncbi:MAG: hypothetical protein FWD94_02890, partial [Treponema sp.]|nr:hypothetical protein [Treponema sp.]
TAASRRAFTEELFSLNRGALPRTGLALPTTVEIAFAAGGSNRRAAGTLEKALRNSGFARPATRGKPARFRLELTLAPESGGRHAVSAVLGDRETGETAFSGRFVLPSLTGSDLYGLAGNVAGAVFRGD